jgi:hypothetical protein
MKFSTEDIVDAPFGFADALVMVEHIDEQGKVLIAKHESKLGTSWEQHSQDDIVLGTRWRVKEGTSCSKPQ